MTDFERAGSRCVNGLETVTQYLALAARQTLLGHSKSVRPPWVVFT
jgi:hypothetical protein